MSSGYCRPGMRKQGLYAQNTSLALLHLLLLQHNSNKANNYSTNKWKNLPHLLCKQLNCIVKAEILTGQILMVWLEGIKNVKISPCQNFALYSITQLYAACSYHDIFITLLIKDKSFDFKV